VLADWIGGAAVFAAGQLTGRYLRVRHRRGVERPREPEAICGCGHHIAFHEAAEHLCHGRNGAMQDRACTCQQYVGPTPLPTYIAGELGG
jgi:hypothetical protein